jgi:hypothetical protein
LAAIGSDGDVRFTDLEGASPPKRFKGGNTNKDFKQGGAIAISPKKKGTRSRVKTDLGGF